MKGDAILGHVEAANRLGLTRWHGNLVPAFPAVSQPLNGCRLLAQPAILYMVLLHDQ